MDPEIIKMFITCAMCKDIYEDSYHKCPRILPCGHCFCHLCLENMIVSSPICPLCNAEVSLKKAELFPINTPIKEMVAEYNKSMQNLNKKNLKEKKYLSEGFCAEHDQEKQFRCMDCDLWVCGTCAHLKHNSCETLLVRDALRKLNDRAADSLTNLFKKISNENDFECKLEQLYKDQIAVLKKDIKSTQLYVKNQVQKLNILHENYAEYSLNKKRGRELCQKLKNEIKNINLNSEKDLNEAKIKIETFKNYLQQQERGNEINKMISLDTNLLKNLNRDGVHLYATRRVGTKLHYGKIESIGEELGIHCFSQECPEKDHLTIPFRRIMTDMVQTNHLPLKVFFKINSGDLPLGKVILEMDAMTPRALNFLLLVSGFKTNYCRGMTLGFGKATCGGVEVSRINGGKLVNERKEVNYFPSFVKGIANKGIYGDPVIERGMIGGNNCESKDRLSSFSIYLEKKNLSPLGKFGKVKSGLEVLDKITKEAEVKECGFII